MRFSDADLKSCRIFRAVVENSGFTGAQIALNISQPSVSAHIKALEQRLGFDLCKRGKSGFQLTEKGERVYEELKRLLHSVEHFEIAMGELRHRLTGALRLGLASNMVTDEQFSIRNAMERFNQRVHDVSPNIHIGTPDMLEKELLNGSIHLAIGNFTSNFNTLLYRKLYDEKNTLYCSAHSPLFNVPPEDITPTIIKDANLVTRAYLNQMELSHLRDIHPRAVVSNMEAQAILILSGNYIGYLADHYAERWVERGELRSLAHPDLDKLIPFQVVTRSEMSTSQVVATFIDDIFNSFTQTNK
ncbi:DNA-binding transcriptional LysR family regulator [Paenochrobactrum gallinarii]|uniref:DNA-binding transcriptional LysR family regulator n=1 Tax=Paenochrobactrum gallinarii TaxID=643673 RepID=A0A841M0C7_9HYPH|nr:LysR family transcriptional regulator [Paenochrobactrum gallinarii]MBB6262222.1 DNA-binding transcriptional LysR family regulator [Paenochrobactrum gallinarii]